MIVYLAYFIWFFGQMKKKGQINKPATGEHNNTLKK
jgi:hypothetical protein